jgi:hypothetical protein
MALYGITLALRQELVSKMQEHITLLGAMRLKNGAQGLSNP